MLSVAFTAWDYDVTYLELSAVVLALVAVGCAAQGLRIAWPFYGLSALAFGYLFVQFDLLASALLQIVFVAAAIWGWFAWGRGGLQQPRSLGWTQRIGLLVASVAGWLVLAPALAHIGAAASLLDSFVLVGSLVAQVLMVRGYTEAWTAWVVVNVVGTYHYAAQDLYMTSLLYFALLLMAIWGWWQWLRQERGHLDAAEATREAVSAQ